MPSLPFPSLPTRWAASSSALLCSGDITFREQSGTFPRYAGLKSASQTHARSIQAPPLCGALLLVEWSGANWLSLATTFVGASSRHQRMH
jgi:hypothetical protein